MAQTTELKGASGEGNMQLPKTIIKVMGNSENFMIEKLEHAIKQASGTDENIIKVLMKKVLDKINGKTTTSTTFINDTIESYLIKEKQYDILDRYISNRLEKNKEYADKVNLLGTRLVTSPDYDRGELQDFTINQIQIAANRYLQRDMKTGDIIESMTGWFDRVASHVVLGSVVHDPQVYDKEGKQPIHKLPEKIPYDRAFGPIKIELLYRLYKKLNSEGKMKYEFQEFSYIVWDLAYPDHSMSDKYQKLYRKYFQYMYQGIFEPNTPTLMNAGTKVGGLSACFTLGVEDNMKSIMNVDTSSALIFKMAGGLGVNVSHIRPKGSNIDGTYGAATGPISLVLELINKITDVVKSGGKRRGANMGLMEYWHPDINEFVDYKIQKIPEDIQTVIEIIKKSGFEDEKQKELIQAITPEGELLNFNISVMFDSKFWEHYRSGTKYHLKFGDKVYGEQDAKEFIQKIAQSAWSSAEPGVAFKDNANRANPLLGLRGEIDICNPCAEQFMYTGESCTLGSINLAKLVREDGTFDWDQYVNIIHETTRFLNDVLEINVYPTEHIAEESNKSKRIGLGIMGLADLLFLLKIPYNSQEGFWMMDELAKTLYIESVKASIDLAEERGSCYWYDQLTDGELIKNNKRPIDSILRVYGIPDNEPLDITFGTEYVDKLAKFGIRNMWTTTVAPTGTISMIADTSSALEPIFALVFSKITNAGKYYYTSELFKQALIEEGIYSQALIEKVEKNYGSCQGIDEIPKHIQKVFVTAIDLHWMDHVVAQAVWQNWIDNSISKTINMPYNVTVNDVRNAYVLAHDLGLKGIALYRDGSRNEQVLHVGSNVQSNKNEQNVQKDTSGTVTVAVKNQVERKEIKPSNYAVTYVKNHIEDHNLIRDVINSGTEFSDRQKTSCPSCSKVSVIKDSGCEKCLDCGWGACSSA